MFQFLSWALLIGLITVVLRCVRPKIDTPSKGQIWVLLCIGILLSAWLAHYRFSIWYLDPWPALASDFIQYCDAIVSAEQGTTARFTQRSPIAAQLVSFLSPHLGIIDGLVISNAIAFVVLSLSIAFWAWLAGGRYAALLSVSVMISFVSFAVMTRMLDFYPLYAAVWTLSASLSALSIKKMNPIWAAIGAGLALLMDPRGLFWALSALAIAAGVSVMHRRWTHLIALLPLLCSYGIANFLIPSDAPSLELQAWWFAQERAGQFNPEPIAWAHDGFVWGHSSILDIPTTLWTLLSLSRPELLAGHHTGLLNERMGYVWPKVTVLLGLFTWLIFSKSRPSWRKFLVLMVPAVPFMLALWQTSTSQIAVRRLLLAWPFAPVFLGFCLSRLWSAHRNRPWLPLVLLYLGLWSLTWSRMDPQWRSPLQEPPDVDALYAVHPEQTIPTHIEFRDQRCEEALRDDLRAGHPWGGRFKMKWLVNP